MGCLLVPRTVVPETPRPPHGKSMATNYEPKPWRGKESDTREDHTQTNMGQPEIGYGAFQNRDDSMLDMNKVKRLLERRHSERQAIEALWADVNLSEPAYFPHIRRMIHIDDEQSHGGGDTILSEQSIDPFARRGRRHSLPALSRPYIVKRVGAGTLWNGERRYQPGLGTNMRPSSHMFPENYPIYDTHPSFERGHSYPTPMNRNVHEPGRLDMQPLSNYSVPMLNVSGPNKPNWSGSRTMSTRSSSRGSSHSVVMGRKPEAEDRTPKSQMVIDSESQMAWASFNPGVPLHGHKDETSEKRALINDFKAHSFPRERFCQQRNEPFEADSSVHRFHKPNEMPSIDYRSFKSTETKRSNGGEMQADAAKTPIESPKKDSDPIDSTDPFGVGTCMSKALEGLLSDASDSSSSVRIGIEYDSKVDTADKENWENIIRGISVGSSSNSLELNTQALATHVSPVMKQKPDDQNA